MLAGVPSDFMGTLESRFRYTYIQQQTHPSKEASHIGCKRIHSGRDDDSTDVDP